MRIDIEKFPALFHKGVIVPNKFGADLRGMMHDTVTIAQEKCYYISLPIMDAMDKSFGKLLTVVTEMPDIYRGLAFTTTSGHPHTMLYSMVNFDKDGTGAISLMMQVHAVDKQGRQMGMLINAYFVTQNGGVMLYTRDTTIDNEDLVYDLARKALAIELFLNFAEIETKVMQPSRQIWDGPTCLYNNKTKFPITVVDSSWYTNLVVSGAFDVAGHFRLQPYGPERSQRRLQWINSFQKTGYTRKAKK